MRLLYIDPVREGRAMSQHVQEPSDGHASAAADLDRRLAQLPSLEARLAEVGQMAPRLVAFSSSLGIEDQAILHAIAAAGAEVDVFTLDTGRLFPETIDTIVRSEQRYALRIRVVAPEAADVEALVARDGVMGFRLSIEARKACCEVRKVRPLKRALAGAGSWITGLRRGQSAGRSDAPFAAWDPERRLVKINPLADWPLDRLEAYIAANDVPVNPLHAQGFPSIGCQPCTRAIRAGDDVRAGRWWWENEDGKECGLHATPRRLRQEAAA
jgi:phosphoadenosine phosphosulfate reductase